MDSRIKLLWLDKLRTAQPNTNGRLATCPVTAQAGIGPVQHSALGWLCELAMQAGMPLVKEKTTNPYLPGYLVLTYNGEAIALPDVVARWADLGPLPWLITKRLGIQNLAYISGHNDGTFAEVIALIETHF